MRYEWGGAWGGGVERADGGKIDASKVFKKVPLPELLLLLCCLSGAGLAALGTNDDEVFEDMKNVLYTGAHMQHRYHMCVLCAVCPTGSGECVASWDGPGLAMSVCKCA